MSARGGQIDMAAEERRARVARVRDAAKTELSQLEAMLLDVQARLPMALDLVQRARQTIEQNTAPVKSDEAS